MSLPIAPYPPRGYPLFRYLHEVEALWIRTALRFCKGNRTKAAAMLEITRMTLYKKMKFHNIAPGYGRRRKIYGLVPLM